MGLAKDIIVSPIAASDANRIIKRLHYSGKVCHGSQVHFGVFLNGKCGGALSFGASLDKRKMLGLVEGTKWNEFIELNRMALADWLPRNGESRVLGVCLHIIKKNYPHIKWVVSFADGTQCGDGTIYRASGFDLTGVKKNSTLLRMPDGTVVADKTLNDHPVRRSGWWKKRGAKALPGFQLRYIYFIDPTARQRLTVPIIPFSEIERRGAGMYLGKPRAGSAVGGTPGDQPGGGGSIPTPALAC